MTLDTVLRDARQQLSAALSLEPKIAALEAQILLAHALHKPRSYLLANPSSELDTVNLATFTSLLQRRLSGEPIAYILGKREFYGFEFRVTPDVLIPRPETELLVDLALALIPEQMPFQILDLGTGSGAIALSLAKLRPEAQVTAVDISPKALAVTQYNTDNLALHNVRFYLSDWFAALNPSTQFDLIIANPPYVAENDPHLSQGDVRFEPLLALKSGVDGFDDIRNIVRAAPAFLCPNGHILIEHGYNQQDKIIELLLALGFDAVADHRDLAGQGRVSYGKKPINMMQ